MSKRILAISFIYVCTAIGWFILAGTMFVRTETQDEKLRGAIGQLWGSKQTQQAPSVYYKSARTGREKGKTQKGFIMVFNLPGKVFGQIPNYK